MFDNDEEESYGIDIGIYPNLTEQIDMFNRVKEIRVEYDNGYTVLQITLDNGTWSFWVFYDVTENINKKENHEKLIKSFVYYLGEMN